MELVEREQALAALISGLASAADGKGRVALLAGEAGIGKSALASRFAAAHRDTADDLWGACDALFTPRPLGPLRDIALHMQGALLTALEADRDRHHLFSLFLRGLRERKRPAIVIFEDVHWADEATLDLIKFLGRRIAAVRALVILTYRDDELDPRHPLRSVLGDLPPETTLRIPLQPLSEQSVMSLARNAGRTNEAARLHAATGGNPFYVTEVLANEGAGVPATVRDAVLARAARLSPSAREALDVASLSPGGIEPWIVEACTDCGAAGLDECASRGMLRLVRGNYVFRHELARLAVLDALSPLRRRELHRAVLQPLRSRPTSPEMLARLAHHAEAADDHEAILEYAPAAGHHAASMGAHREAIAHFTGALRYADAIPPRDRALLLAAHADESYATGDMEGAILARRRAGKIWRELGEPLMEGDNLCRLMGSFISAGRDREAEEVSRAALEILEPLPPGPQLAFAYRTQAAQRMLQRDYAQAIEWAEKAVALADRFNDSETLVSAYNILGCSSIQSGDEERGRGYLEKSLALALDRGQQHQVFMAYANAGCAFGEYYRFELAERYLAPGIAYTTERDYDHGRLYMMSWQALSHLHQGRWNAAADTALAVLDAPGRASISHMASLVALGRLRARRGDPGAMEALDKALELAQPTASLQRIAPVRAARAEAAWLAGDAATTISEARAVYPLALAKSHPWFIGELAYWQWKAGALDAPPELAAAPFRLQMQRACTQAAAAWEARNCPYEAARALAEAEDESSLKRALRGFDHLGARSAADRVRQQLRELGLRSIPRGPRSSTRTNAFQLTSRELEVIALLAQGLTNAEIAARLYRSAKTVDHHVSSVLSKLSVSTREAAVAAATAQGLLPK